MNRIALNKFGFETETINIANKANFELWIINKSTNLSK